MTEYSWNLDNQGSDNKPKAEFTKFPEGITRIRVVDDAPYQRWTHYIQQYKRSINCPGKGCPICEMRRTEKMNKLQNKYPMTKKFSLNVINRETNRIEIMEQGKTFMQDLVDLMNDLHNENRLLRDADIKVRRRGTGKDDTSYRLDIDKIYPMSHADEELMKNRITLDEYFKPHTPEQILRILNGEDWNTVMSGENPEVGQVNNLSDEDMPADMAYMEEDIELS